MSGIDVLPRALGAAARAVRHLAGEVEAVRAEELGDAELTAAFQAYAAAWSGAELVLAAEQRATALDTGAREYLHVESLLLPRVLR